MVNGAPLMSLLAPYLDNPVIPPIVYRDALKMYIEELIVTLSFGVLEFENNEFPLKKQAYRKLTSKGFQNSEFIWLSQLAADYCDFLMFGGNNRPTNVVTEVVKKSIELYLAQLYDETQQKGTMLPGAQNYYRTLLKEYPELKRKINEHLSKYGNDLGEDKMSNQNYPTQYTDGNWYMMDGYGRPYQVPPPPQSLDQQWNNVHQRRQMNQQRQQYVQQPPPQQVHPLHQQNQNQNWGVNPTQQQQQYQGHPQQQQQTQGYANYNHSQQQPQNNNANGMGPYTGTPVPTQNNQTQSHQQNQYQTNNQPQQQQQQQPVPQQQPVQNGSTPMQPHHNGAHSGQRHTDFSPPQPAGTKVEPVVPTPKPGQPSANASAPVETKIENQLIKTHTGYECEYFAAQNGIDGVNVALPILFDPVNKKGIYQFNWNKVLVDFKTVPYEDNNVNYEQHETAQFFNKVREDAPEPTIKTTAALLANIQRDLFVKEILNDVERVELEGNVTGDTGKHDLSKPLMFDRTVVVDILNDNYIGCLLEAYEDVDLDTRVVNYEQLAATCNVLPKEVGLEALKLRECKDWFQLKEILSNMVEAGLSIADWGYFNDIITNFINDVLKYRLQVPIVITSFDMDIDDLIKMLHKTYSIRNEFSTSVKTLCRTALYPHVLDSNSTYLYPERARYEDEPVTDVQDPNNEDEELEDDFDEAQVVFSRLIDVTLIPIESSSIYLPLPQENDEWVKELPPACVVTLTSFPELYRAIDDRVANSNYRAAGVVFVTRDGKTLYIKETSSRSAYVICRTL